MTNIFDHKTCNRNLRILWIFTVCINALFILAICVPYYQNQLGLSFHQFLMIESAFALVLVICDVPTGWLADHFGIGSALMLHAAILAMCGAGTFVMTQRAHRESATKA